ncbi:retrovirus-related pol polyprotein from transposon TNT 1-94 [Tanacetum coccineum]|uniref:Retrovirus-related pol polyprotein from transposon TNT 1-94 n=1 Tax=Tanacetum coccineum TaxID=301880 RepID=A0ABQ5CRF9_9ASTR
MMNEMIINNLTVATMQVNVQFLQQLQPEWSRFVTIVKQQHKLDEVSYHKLFDILKQYQKEVNELRAERMAKNANPLALVATAQTLQDPYYQTSKPHKSYAPTSKASLPTRSHATTRYKGKEIAKPITPPSESASKEDSDPEQAQKDKDMQKNLALIANIRISNQTGQFGNQRAVNVVGARETIGGPVVQQSGIQCFNYKEFGHYAKECRKPKWVKDSTYHKEKMLLSTWSKIQEVPNATQVLILSHWNSTLISDDELIELESDKAEFSNMYDMLLQECVSKDIYTELLRSFAKLEKHSISLEIALQECQEQLKNDTVCKEKASNVFRKEREQYFEIQDLKAQLQDKNIAISELKKLIEKCKGKSVDTKFDKPSVVRQPNAQRIPKPSVLGKPTPFSDSLERKYFAKKKSVLKTNESEGLSKPVTPQNLPQTATQAVRNTNVIKPGMSSHRTNVSRPQLRSTQMKDKSIAASNDSLKSITSNVNAVCATCGKCVFNLNHDACVSKYLNDVNARTKKPKVVPISTRKPKSQANKSVATPLRKQLHQNPLLRNPRVTIGYCMRELVRHGNGG